MREKGFTLIEVMTVVGVIAFVTVALLSIVNPGLQLKKANDTKRKTDLAQIQRGLEVYYNDNGKYPAEALSCNYSILGNNGDFNDCIEWGKPWTPYMDIIPQDKGSKKYVYHTTVDRQSYYLYASLENTGQNSGICPFNSGTGNNQCPNVPIGATCGGSNDICNYGVSSPNTSP